MRGFGKLLKERDLSDKELKKVPHVIIVAVHSLRPIAFYEKNSLSVQDKFNWETLVEKYDEK